jgi:hypothetical protein
LRINLQNFKGFVQYKRCRQSRHTIKMNDLLTFLETEYIKKVDCKLRFLLGKYSIEEIVRAIVGWLNSGKSNYFDTTTFARDFYIGSDLTLEEKEIFYSELKRQGFFDRLSELLYSNNFNICSWSIYTIGKFSEEENARYLENAYEKYFISANPILAYRCLKELDWLGSKKAEHYLDELRKGTSIISKLILLFYWEPKSDNKAFKELITDKGVLSFLAPSKSIVDMDEASIRLFAFENYISELYSSSQTETIDKKELTIIAEDFFKSYSATVDPQAETDHQGFLKQLKRN